MGAPTGPAGEVRRGPVIGVDGKWPVHGQNDVIDPMYVPPCVARVFRRASVSGPASMYPSLIGAVSLRTTMDISARRSDCRTDLNGQLGRQCSCAGKTDPSSRLMLSQTSAAKGLGLLRRLAFQCSRRLGGLSNGQGEFARFGGASMRKKASDDAGQPLPYGFASIPRPND